jgi:hypothetical protein
VIAKSNMNESTYRRKGPFRVLLNVLSSVWLGIGLVALIFVYCTIGSAIPQIRKHPFFEMTEFEWFHWWPFNAMMILFCINMLVVTIRRIPLRPINAGVWMIHSGIIVLTLGSFYYFSTKIEGDTPVFRRQVLIEHPSLSSPASLIVSPGNQTSVTIGPDLWRFSIQNTNTEWPILSDEHAGKKAYAVNVAVTPPQGESFVRQLLGGYPQYTEDILPGKGRAINNIGRKLVNENLNLSLEYKPQTYFHVMQSWALYVRRLGDTEWTERPIRGLPRYNDHVGSRDLVFHDPHFPIATRALDVTVPPAPGGDALSTASVHITGYLRYARMERRWREGAQLNPVLKLSLHSDHAAPTEYELIAFDATRNTAAEGNVQLIWLNDRTKLNDLPGGASATLHLAVPEKDIAMDIPLTQETVVGPEGAFIPIEGTGFSYRIMNVHDHLALPGRSETVSIVMVDVKTPEGERFTRMVADRPEMTRDMRDGDPHMARSPEEADGRLVLRYSPASAPIVFAGYPGGLHFIFNGPEGRRAERSVKAGDAFEIMPGTSLRVDGFWPNAVPDVKPFIVPPPSRVRDAGETFAMIRLEVDTGRGVESRWVQFNQYALPNSQYAYRGRFAYLPEVFRLSDGSVVEVLFSRERHPLPNPVALHEFELDTHIGGYAGTVSTIRNYHSRLRFLANGQWTDPVTIAVNNPTENGGFWYFQSMWDKPPNENPAGGMNYTGLGVGNRNGVYVQLAGCCLSVVGMFFAFYVKPMMKRRRAEHARARLTGEVWSDERIMEDFEAVTSGEVASV